jgi:predicted TIM-barrel fold metal-dependent hydrolase
VRFTPFPGEDVAEMVAISGPELYLFSSDYPHPEGTKNPIERFESNMGDMTDDQRDRFYRRNYEAMMGSAAGA